MAQRSSGQTGSSRAAHNEEVQEGLHILAALADTRVFTDSSSALGRRGKPEQKPTSGQLEQSLGRSLLSKAGEDPSLVTSVGQTLGGTRRCRNSAKLAQWSDQPKAQGHTKEEQR